MAPASAKVTKIWFNVSGRHNAFDPVHQWLDIDASTTATSQAQPLISTRSTLLRMVASALETPPVATRPVAIPAMVASRIAGNKHIVGARGKRHEGDLSAGGGYKAMSAVAAKHDDRADLGSNHAPHSVHCVRRAIFD